MVYLSICLCCYQFLYHCLVIFQVQVFCLLQFSSVAQSHSALCDPMDCTCQASLSITNSWNLPKLMSTGSVITSNHLIVCCSLLLPHSIFPSTASESFPMSQLSAWGGQSTGVSALASFLPKNTQSWFPLEWTGWISLHMYNKKAKEEERKKILFVMRTLKMVLSKY